MTMTVDEFFSGRAGARALFDVLSAQIETLGDFTVHVSRNQIAFRRNSNFAIVWTPDRYLKGKTAPLVLTFSFPYRDGSPRWKEIVEAVPGHFTHHLELYEAADFDDEVIDWLRKARQAAA